MATVETALMLIDNVARPLQKLTRALQVNVAMQAIVQMNFYSNMDALDVMKGKIEKVENAFDQATEKQDGMKKKQEQVNESMKKGANEANGLFQKIKSMATKHLTLENGIKLGKSALDGAMEQQKVKDMFIARTGNVQVGTAMFDKFRADAVKAGQDVNASLQGTLSFFSATQNTGQLAKLNQFAQKMSVFDTAGGGIEGAAAALKEAMSGDVGSLTDRFNIPKSDIKAFKIEDLGKSGNIEGFIKAFDQLLKKQKMGNKVFDTLMASPVKQAEMLNNNVESSLADAGSGAIQALQPVMEAVNQAFQSGKFQAFFNTLNIGLSVAAYGFSRLVNGALWLFGVIQQGWSIIEPIIWVIAGALAAWAITQIPLLYSKIVVLVAELWAMVTPILAQAAAWALANWPMLMLGALVGFLLYAMLKWGEGTVQVIGVVGGLFGVLFASIFNKLAYFINIALSIEEFLRNVWRDPVYAIQKLFFDLVINVLQYMQNLAKGIENIINKIPGLKVDMTSGMDNLLKRLKDARDSLKSDKDVVTLMRLEQVDYGDAFNKGQSLGKTSGKFIVSGIQDAFEPVKGMFSKNKTNFLLNNDKVNTSNMVWDNNINKVNEVGKINDTVDISSEDLETMRELAEMKNIQNFVTLTPTVQVTTGPITNGYDADTIIKRIEKQLEEEFVSAAEGVYAL